MASKYHLSDDGTPRVCTAGEGNCPIGSEEQHFSTQIAARAAFEARQATETVVPSLKKKLTRDERAAAEVSKGIEYDTVIPTREYEQVEKDIEVSKLKGGDWVLSGKETATVLEVKRGTKNATIKVRGSLSGNEKTIVLPLSDTVRASVKTETAASAAAQREAYVEHELERTLKNYEPKRAKALANISVMHQKGYSPRSWEFAALLDAEANDSVMSTYENTVDNVKKAVAEKREGYENVTNPYTRAYENVKAQFSKEILSQAERGGDNSTSEMSNLYDKEMLAAKAKFISRAAWF